eukprot:gnl/Chilomastix_caulleri/3687.p3 GENE.gnl/Chilomastix_caulleri/3687~~gnl/Chilomastix_caulleri/3687.p3  ORF type:complete len:100 (+),score=20.51 gnl/Chilomastix_caulleri/3687:225-524(+)
MKSVGSWTNSSETADIVMASWTSILNSLCLVGGKRTPPPPSTTTSTTAGMDARPPTPRHTRAVARHMTVMPMDAGRMRCDVSIVGGVDVCVYVCISICV